MGQQQSTKYHLTPPRIFLLRKDYFLCGKIHAGQLSRRVTEDFLCPPEYALGGSLLLAEPLSEDVVVRCDADIAVGPDGTYANGGACVASPHFLTTAELSGRELELGFMTTPTSFASLFTKMEARVGHDLEYAAGLIFRPTFLWSRGHQTDEFDGTEMYPTVTSSGRAPGTRRDHRMPPADKPMSSASPMGVGPAWRPQDHQYTNQRTRLETALRFYAKKRVHSVAAGTHCSLRAGSIFSEIVAEADMESGEMRRSDVAVSFLLDERDRTQPTQHTVGNLEVALTLRNASALFDSRPESTPVEKEKEPLFSVSFYKHLVVPRKIFLAVDPRYKLISNYIDLAFEIGLNPKRFVDAMPSNTPADSSVARVEDIPVDMRLGGSWQLNKNNLVKFKVDQHSFTSSYTFKSWWKPRFSLSACWSYNWKTQKPSLGWWIVLDTADNLEHEVASATFRDSVGYSVVDYVPIEDEDLV